MQKNGFAGLQACALKEIAPDSEIGFRDTCGLDHREACWHRNADISLHNGFFRIGTARDKRHDAVARTKPGYIFRDFQNNTGKLQPQDIRYAWRRRILTGTLHCIGPVDTSGVDTHAHFTPLQRW